MRLVVDAPDLPTLQQHAMDLGRERNFKARITRMRRSRAWGDLGDLKRELSARLLDRGAKLAR